MNCDSEWSEQTHTVDVEALYAVRDLSIALHATHKVTVRARLDGSLEISIRLKPVA